MDVQVCQHVPFEGPAAIADWALVRGHSLAVSRLDRGDPFPPTDDFDLLVVLGGPMGVGDDADHPWLSRERELIQDALGADRTVLGICLGAQQLAATLGADVGPHEYREIGWYPVEATPDAADTVFETLPATYPAFHWHGDSFTLPEGATLTATSEACRNQAFVAQEGRAIGVQFHLEATPDSVETLVEADGVPDGFDAGAPWIQDREAILAADASYEDLRASLFALLDGIVDAA